ncbi:cytochrome d ubiquinol oxidase subunit II [Serinibacter arcticus]|uniref:Cytochrome d ubiquinol oxidase subunit II n=1 Tax=Serinibacter arcticus TaxID=1655435 RepID=A0A2U1ZXE5_9MICO|nr:cytochrome d ubiquinol oxidase subunit II [Serinibacter arcticus]PWD51641.1 cytochrome d ubiquinol oxidase subunit II [Serinibacter arcticus]
MDLAVLWFGLVVLCWVLFLVLEGFDFGVGMLAPVLGRDAPQRGAALRTIAPVWDGNEVWLVAAVGVTFAAFPDWYASMLSGLYLPMVALLLGLAVRGVALEFRGKKDDDAWRTRCDLALAFSSAAVAAILGAVLGVLAGGLAIGADGEVAATGGALARTLGVLVTPAALIGAAVGVTSALLLGATYLSLRTTGPVRERARSWVAPAAGALALAAMLAVATSGLPWWLGAVAVALLGAGVLASRRGREGWAFAVVVVLQALVVVALFVRGAPVLLASTLDPAWSITIASAAASDTALTTISWAALFILPGVLVYQALAYWVFRRRVSSDPVPT